LFLLFLFFLPYWVSRQNSAALNSRQQNQEHDNNSMHARTNYRFCRWRQNRREFKLRLAK